LDVGNNLLKKVEKLSHLTQLEEFWVNRSEIAADQMQGNQNQFDSYPDIEKEFGKLSQLETVYFEGNPIQQDPQYRLKLKLLLPSIKQIDATFIRPASE
jgi:protein phosphatase 1 regulatory subunit 7